VRASSGRAAIKRLRGALLFAVLAAAATAAAAVALSARGPGLEIQVRSPHWSFRPDGRGARHVARIRFTVADGDPLAIVSIVGKHRHLIKTLDSSARLVPGRPVTYQWDGTTNSGRPAPAGSYRLRVQMPSQDRDMVYPRDLRLPR
jgi:hypothetical protein